VDNIRRFDGVIGNVRGLNWLRIKYNRDIL
jgi:hypothetical protein